MLILSISLQSMSLGSYYFELNISHNTFETHKSLSGALQLLDHIMRD